MFKLQFETTNAIFQDDADEEVARILRDLAERVQGHIPTPDRRDGSGAIRDDFGNTIGHFTWKAEA